MNRFFPVLLALLVADLAVASDSPRSIPQQAEMAFKSDAFEQALGLYRQLTNGPAGSSNSVEVLDRIGDCLFRLGRYDEAVPVYQECLVKFPKGSGRCYVAQKLGDCYAVLGQTNEAFRLYDVGFQAYGYPVFDKTQRVANLSQRLTGGTNILFVKSPLVIKHLFTKPRTPPPLDSVMLGLRWLVSSQNPEGSWGDNPEELEASTGLALLAFFGHGEVPSSYEFGKPIGRGLKYLLSVQQTTNLIEHADQAKAISHAISTWALCEGYALTRIPHLKTPAEDGLAVILKGQRPSGLWNGAYTTDDGEDDMEASIWQVLALHSGKMAGSQLDGLQVCLDKAVAGMGKALEANPNPGTKAGLVFCLQLCGQGHKPIVRTAITNLTELTPDWDAPSFGDPIFRWFLTTEAIFQNGGKPWMNWNRQFNPMLVNHQVKQDGSGGKSVGYWDSPGKKERFGRVYSTALSLLMLEIYYPTRLPSYEYDRVTASTNDVVIIIE